MRQRQDLGISPVMDLILVHNHQTHNMTNSSDPPPLNRLFGDFSPISEYAKKIENVSILHY